MRGKTNKILKTLCIYTLVISMMLSSLVGSWDVMAAGIEAPTVTKAFIGTNTISGGNLHRGKINGKNARGTVHVTLKDSSGNKKATVSVTPKSGKTWTVNLPEGVEIAEGDTVTAYQEFDGQNSPATTANAMDSLAKQNKDKLKMPTGEIWIENTSSNLVNEDEQAEAVEMFNKLNGEIAGDISAVKFSIDGTSHAYYEVTYTDGSTSGKVEAKNLEIKQVEETSRAANLESITVVDNVIKGKLEGKAPFDNIKVQLILKVNDADESKFCNDKCSLDKNSSKPVEANLDSQTGEFTYTINSSDKIELGNIVGVIVKEKNKFQNCSSKKTVTLKTPEKIEVKDPRKLTDKDKEAIDLAIRDANKVGDVSKLPNGTGFIDDPAFIEFDKDGNVRIISPNDVEVEWDSNYNPVYVKNEDGSYKLQEGKEDNVITIPAKELVKNIKPEKPELKEENNKVTITPNKDDTDIVKVTVKYKDKNNEDKTVEITKTDGNWTIPEGSKLSVDATTGLFTFDSSDVINGGTVTAQFTDNGGLNDDEKPLPSDETSIKLSEKVDITFDSGEGTGEMAKQTAKKGSKYTLPESKFTAPDNKEFEGWKVGDSDEVQAVGTEITVDKNTKLTAVYKKSTTPGGGTEPGGGTDPGQPNPDPSQPGDGNEPNPNPNPGENPGDNPGTNPGDQPGKPGADPSKPWEKPIPDSHAYNPWWPIWFGSSDVKKAAPKVEYERGLHHKYLYGYKDNTVRPEGLITRAEAAALIARLAELDMSNNMKPNFKDTPSAWYNTAINAVLEKDLMFADKDGNFRPNEPITRGEFARAMFFIDKKNNAVAPFADVKGHVYEEAINQAYGNNRIKGYPDGTFKPDATITRAEAATILNHYADRNVNFPGIVEVHKDVIKFKDLDQSHWAYYEIMEAANTHEYQREKGTIPETWEEIIEKYN